jgi:3-deoxy-D-manno-octulosonate 8-phosphate phosphatase (KDO 8-P phosphatase)
VIDPQVAARVRILGLDVDGVLTDNAIYLGLVGGERVELKRFDIQDGLALSLLRGGPVEVFWLSGRFSEATTLRARELGIATVIQEPGARKLPAMTELLAARGLEWSQVAFVGDDLADVPLLRRVGLPIAVANAIPEVKRLAHWVTPSPGGQGAVRETVTELLKARGEWEGAMHRYLAERGDG